MSSPGAPEVPARRLSRNRATSHASPPYRAPTSILSHVEKQAARKRGKRQRYRHKRGKRQRYRHNQRQRHIAEPPEQVQKRIEVAARREARRLACCAKMRNARKRKREREARDLEAELEENQAQDGDDDRLDLELD